MTEELRLALDQLDVARARLEWADPKEPASIDAAIMHVMAAELDVRMALQRIRKGAA